MDVWKRTQYFEKSYDGGPPSPRFVAAHDGIKLTREIFVVPGTYQAIRIAFEDFLGYPKLLTGKNRNGVNASYISRTLPHGYVASDGITQDLFCVSVTQGVGKGISEYNDDISLSEQEEVLLTLEYRAPSYDVLSDVGATGDPFLPGSIVPNPLSGLPDEAGLLRYVTRFWRPAGRMVTLPAGAVHVIPDDGETWKGNNNKNVSFLPVPNGLAFREPRLEMMYVISDFPRAAVNMAGIQAQFGTINNNIFDPSVWAFPKGTALFIDADFKEYPRLVTGEKGGDLHLKFIIAPNIDLGTYSLGPVLKGFNSSLWPIPQGGVVDYRRLAVVTKNVDGSFTIGPGPYRSSDFSALCRPRQPS